MTTYGVTSSTQAPDNLIASSAGLVIEERQLDSTVGTAARGQVLTYDAANNNWVKFTSYTAGDIYAVLFEAVVITVDTWANCIVKGEVFKAGLDSTAQADADFQSVAAGSGLIVKNSIAVE